MRKLAVKQKETKGYKNGIETALNIMVKKVLKEEIVLRLSPTRLDAMSQGNRESWKREGCILRIFQIQYDWGVEKDKSRLRRGERGRQG